MLSEASLALLFPFIVLFHSYYITKYRLLCQGKNAFPLAKQTLPLKGAFQSVEKLDFRQTVRVQKGGKTSKPSSSAYDGTVDLGLRCKSKCLAQQAFEVLFCCIGDTFAIAYLNTDRQPPKICILTIGDFFDTLKPSPNGEGLGESTVLSLRDRCLSGRGNLKSFVFIHLSEAQQTFSLRFSCRYKSFPA